MKKIILTVTNDLTYDQRMIRICTSLANNGYAVLLVGIRHGRSVALTPKPYRQQRIGMLFKKGVLFYIEYNIRLFFFLMFRPADCICAIDLDTILPCFLSTAIKRVPRVYDAHELFCEMKEIVHRPVIYKIWKTVEKFAVPRFSAGYTVNRSIADEFERSYGVKYRVIRNITVLTELEIPERSPHYMLYQGSVNEGRSFETLIPAMKQVNAKLIICGTGNFLSQAVQLVKDNDLSHKVIFKGNIEPAQLLEYTRNAYIGLTLFENNGLNNYLSLANRFFDYMHAAVPQLCVAYPAYKEINNTCEVAVLIADLSPENIAGNCNRLLNDAALYKSLQQNCLQGRIMYNWQQEEKILIGFYQNILR